MTEKAIYDKNSEIFYLYDCKLCNPNGDPDDENKPRMDYETGRNLVSDVRLKRYFRDYFAQKGMEIFVGQNEGFSDNAKTAMAKILGLKNEKKINILEDDVKKFLLKTIDSRLFGAVVPDVVVNKGKAKKNFAITGPVQFNWGYSLNRVSIIPSNAITSHFQTGKQSDKENQTGKGAGAIGKDYRLYYSLIGFYGIISAARAKETYLSEEDVALLDEALIKAIPLTATSRSKNNQMPRLVLRVEYNKNMFIGDLRRYVKFMPKKKEEEVRDLVDYELDVDLLVDVLAKYKDAINLVRVCQDRDLMLKGGKTLKRMLIEKGFSEDKVKHFDVAS
jgi:CRISPR-associated protein Csh2